MSPCQIKSGCQLNNNTGWDGRGIRTGSMSLLTNQASKQRCSGEHSRRLFQKKAFKGLFSIRWWIQLCFFQIFAFSKGLTSQLVTRNKTLSALVWLSDKYPSLFKVMCWKFHGHKQLFNACDPFYMLSCQTDLECCTRERWRQAYLCRLMANERSGEIK